MANKCLNCSETLHGRVYNDALGAHMVCDACKSSSDIGEEKTMAKKYFVNAVKDAAVMASAGVFVSKGDELELAVDDSGKAELIFPLIGMGMYVGDVRGGELHVREPIQEFFAAGRVVHEATVIFNSGERYDVEAANVQEAIDKTAAIIEKSGDFPEAVWTEEAAREYYEEDERIQLDYSQFEEGSFVKAANGLLFERTYFQIAGLG